MLPERKQFPAGEQTGAGLNEVLVSLAVNRPKTPEPAPGSNINSRMRVSKLDMKDHWK
jgi:hypothetical protein